MKTRSIGVIEALALSCLVLALAACGSSGNGGAATAPSAPSAEGLWIGSTNDSRSVTGLVLDDGTYWILYSVQHASSLTAGFVEGSGSSLGGSFSSSNGIDFNVEGRGINSSTLSASYMAKQSLDGSVTYPTLNQTFTFTTSYNAEYEQTPSVSAIAGTYVGIASVVGSNELTTVVVNSPGVIAGTGNSGCKFFGTIRPRASGNVYDLSLSFSGPCPSGTSSVSGIGYFDSSAKRLYLAALNQSRSNGLIFTGTQP